MYVPVLASLASFLSSASAFTIPQRRDARDVASYPIHSQVVYQFPDPTWVENIAVCGNGQLLVTTVANRGVYLVDPFTSYLDPSPSPNLIATFPQNSVLGITETTPDQFYVVVEDLNLSTLETGNFSIWSIDLTSYDYVHNTGAKVSEIISIPQSQGGLLNGMATLSISKGLLVIADSFKGLIGLLNLKTKEYNTLLQEPEMAVSTTPGSNPLGINGIHVLHSPDSTYIYFSNTGTGIDYRIPFDVSTLQKSGLVETLESGVFTDDFAVDKEKGLVYATNVPNNRLVQFPLTGGGVVQEVIGSLNSSVLPGPTSVAVGRGGNSGTIYITTNGGLLKAINGTYTEGGKIVAVDVGF